MVREDVQGVDPSLLALDQVLLRRSCEQPPSALSKFVFAPGIDFGLPRPEPNFGVVLADLAESGEDTLALVLLVDILRSPDRPQRIPGVRVRMAISFVDLRLGRPRSIYAFAQASSSGDRGDAPAAEGDLGERR